MLADLVVLDRDPTRGGHIRDASVAITVAGGRVVYEEN
jgi:predicted amidohydrolase YtcJ